MDDLDELGLEDELTVQFNAAAQHVQTIAGNLDNGILLNLYGYYKQGNDGPCNIPKPSWFDMKAKSKWEAWKKLGNLSKNEAKVSYIDLVKMLDVNFDAGDGAKKETWVTVSTLQKPQEPDRSLTDFIKAGNVEMVKQNLQSASEINQLDADGLGLIHWAADRGSVEILDLLIRHGADVNLRDNDGQIPLHYAVSCEHVECIEYLLHEGADPRVKDSDGLDCFAAASDDTVLNLLRDHQGKAG